MFDSILISLDGSEEAEAVLPVMEKILSAAHAKVILVRVAPEVNYINAQRDYTSKLAPDLAGATTENNSLYAAKEREMASYLKEIAVRLERAGASSVAIEYSFNDPVPEIMSCVKRHHIDLIAMATHGRSGLNRLVHGSTTESVLHNAPCPMLVVRTNSED